MAQVFSNASFRGLDRKAGLVLLFGLMVCGCMQDRYLNGPKVFSPKEAKVKAILCMLKETRVRGSWKINLFLSDACEVIQSIKSQWIGQSNLFCWISRT